MKGNFIYYFKSKNSVSAKGVIPLQEALAYYPEECNEIRKFMFHIQTAHRIYNLAAEDPKSLKEWIDTINEAINNITHNQLDLFSPQIQLNVEENYWETIRQESYSFPKNCDKFVELTDEDCWLREKNEEYFGPLPHNDPEKDVFFALAYKFLHFFSFIIQFFCF